MGDTAKVLEEFAKDRAVWLDRFEELQRSHYDKRAELLQTDFQRRIEEKDAQMDNMRSNAEQLLAQFREAAAERDHINQQLAGFTAMDSDKNLSIIYIYSFSQRRRLIWIVSSKKNNESCKSGTRYVNR